MDGDDSHSENQQCKCCERSLDLLFLLFWNHIFSASKTIVVPPPSPFLFTRYIRPISSQVKSFLLSHNAKLFASIWAAYSTEILPGVSHAKSESDCLLPPSWTSKCSDSVKIPQWTFNSSLDMCQPYWYNGCGATSNLFSNEKACKTQCRKEREGTKIRLT